MNNKITKKEKLFAFIWGMGEHPAAAARQAGLKEDAASLMALLENPGIQTEAERWQSCSKSQLCRQAARQGLERLAFGSIEDAVRLVFLEELPEKEELARMNLACISEIKRPKGGGCEIKLVDRIKALELLASLPEEKESTGADSFLKALESSVRCFEEREG